MKTKDFMEGLHILHTYYNNPDGYHLRAEHDTIYIYATDTEITEEDVEHLCYLGFIQEDVELEAGEEFAPANYDPDEGWVAYV
jgi:hypothetical protein